MPARSLFKDRLPSIAKEAGVALLVSKWDVVYRDPSIEYVDVTMPLVKLLNPSKQILQMIEQLKTQDPVPIESMPPGIMR